MGQLGKKIQALRQAKVMTLMTLAKKVNKTAGYLSRVESRDEIPSPELICLISEALEAKAETLLEFAKQDQLKRVEEQIELKSNEALTLFRRSK